MTAKSPGKKATASRRPRERKDETPTPEHLAWVIERRAANQQVTLRLYEIFHARRVIPEELHYRAQDLVAVSFSLWRAVFLADRTGVKEFKDEDAEKFLAKMLTDNAITYTQDRNTREWSCNYYLGNARHRLETAAKRWPSIERHLGKHGSARTRWDALQAGFTEGVAHLAAELKAISKKSPKK